jgi:four helix bundle protein
MATINKFEDLVVWKNAMELTDFIYKLTNGYKFKKDYDLVDQIRRSSVSIVSNIAEGFERGTKHEFINYLFIAKGSCGETRSQVYIAYNQGYINKEEFESAISLCKRTSSLLYALIKSVKEKSGSGLQYT